MSFPLESLIGPQDLRYASPWVDSLQSWPRPHSARHFRNKLAHGHAPPLNFEIAWPPYISADTHDSCPGVVGAPQPGIFRAAHRYNVFHVTKRFHVIDDRWTHVETQHGGEIGRLDPWIVAFAFQRFDQTSFFATDVSACPTMNINLGGQ